MNLSFKKLRGTELYFVDPLKRKYCYSVGTIRHTPLWNQVPETIRAQLTPSKELEQPNSNPQTAIWDQLNPNKLRQTQQFVVIDQERSLIFPYPSIGFSIRNFAV